MGHAAVGNAACDLQKVPKNAGASTMNLTRALLKENPISKYIN